MELMDIYERGHIVDSKPKYSSVGKAGYGCAYNMIIDNVLICQVHKCPCCCVDLKDCISHVED